MAEKLMSAVRYFVWDYFTSLLYSIKKIHLQHRHQMNFGKWWVKDFHNWHINLIKQGWIFSAQTKNGGMLYWPDHIHEKCYKYEPCLQCLNVRDSDHFTLIHSLWDFWLVMLIYYHFSIILLLLRPQAFAITAYYQLFGFAMIICS